MMLSTYHVSFAWNLFSSCSDRKMMCYSAHTPGTDDFVLQGEVGDYSCIGSKLVSDLKRQRSSSEQHLRVSNSLYKLSEVTPLLS